jgi:hypothetical protein
LVAVRCTFQIHPDGTTSPAEEQDPVVMAPKHLGEPGASSLRYDTDFVLTKPTTDVILHGCAYAPGGEPATTVDVSLRVGAVRKALRVTGDRPYQQSVLGVAVGPVQPFTKMPLTYERAYGGGDPADPTKDRRRFDERNPVGTGYGPAVGNSAPNVEYPGLGTKRRPAGFGPISSHWQPRAGHGGTYDDAWRKKRAPLYPDDLDDRFFLCSPEDQRPAKFLRGGEPVELINLTPGGRLAFVLPRVALGFETVFRTGERVRHKGALHTVILEPDAPRVVLVWRTSLPCHSKVQSLLRTQVWPKRIIAPEPGQPVPAGEEEDE